MDARREDYQGRRHDLAVRLERLASLSTVVAGDIRDGAPITVELRDRLEVRMEAVAHALDLEKAARP